MKIVKDLAFSVTPLKLGSLDIPSNIRFMVRVAHDVQKMLGHSNANKFAVTILFEALLVTI